MRRAASIVIASVLLLVGCGDAGSSENNPTTNPATNPATNPTIVPSSAVPSSTVPSSTVADSPMDPDPTSPPAMGDDVLQRLLDAARQDYGAPGAVALLRSDGHEWSATSGAADVAGTPLTGSTRFRIASITKPIVAALMLDAVARGEVTLEDVVGEIVGDVLRPDPPITVRMILDHTSGVFNAGDEGDILADISKLTDAALREEAEQLAARYLAGEEVTVSGRLFVALAETHDRYFPPGEGIHYSNVNYHLAALVLEAVTGQPLDVLLRARIFQPLGLRDTTLAPADARPPDMRGYRIDESGVMVDATTETLGLGGGGGGGVISTATELMTIMQAIVGGGVLPEALMEDMQDATPASYESYGLGLATYFTECGKFYGHGGALSGTTSIALVSADATISVVLAINLRRDVDADLLALAETLICALSPS